jgi:hypothetical protein
MKPSPNRLRPLGAFWFHRSGRKKIEVSWNLFREVFFRDERSPKQKRPGEAGAFDILMVSDGA